jgi:hypothetical protein
MQILPPSRALSQALDSLWKETLKGFVQIQYWFLNEEDIYDVQFHVSFWSRHRGS